MGWSVNAGTTASRAVSSNLTPPTKLEMDMKVFVAQMVNHYDQLSGPNEILGVYKSREEAKEAFEAYEFNSQEDLHIHEVELK